MRLSIPLTLTSFFLFSPLSNAIPTTPSLATRAAHELRTDIVPLSPHSLSSRDLSTPTKILSNTLRILHNDLTIAISSANSAAQVASFYAGISSAVRENVAGAPTHYFSFTLGVCRMVVSCAMEAMPWVLVGDIVRDLREWMRGRWAPVEASLRFLGANPYLVAAPAVIVVSVSLVGHLVGELGRG